MQETPENTDGLSTEQEHWTNTRIQRALAMLDQHENGVSEPKIDPSGHVAAKLANPVDPDRPYKLIIHPIAEQMILRVCVLPIAKLRSGSSVPQDLAHANLGLRVGCASVTANGVVTYMINHVCRSDDDTDPPAGLVERLIDEAITATRLLEEITLAAAISDAGVPSDRAQEMVKALVSQVESDRVSEDETL